MGIRKITLVIFSLLIVGVLIAGTPTRKTIKSNYVKLMSAGAWDTITISQIELNGDSVGFALDFNKDSIAGKVIYQMTTLLGNSNTTLATAPSLTLSDASTSFTNVGEIQAVFTQNLPRVAGMYYCNIYLLIKNNNTTATTVTTNVYQITWR
jgi:hypothetical protein